MSDMLIDMLAEHFGLSPEEEDILRRSRVDLTRREKRLFRRELAPRMDRFRSYLAEAYRQACRTSSTAPRDWATATALSILQKGYADFTDSLALELIGRKPVSDILKYLKGQAGAFSTTR